MKQLFKLLCVAALTALAGAAVSAEISLYSGEGYRGRAMTLDQSAPNLESSRFNDRANSAVIRGGVWQLCSDADFRGRCVTLQRGEYPSLAALGLDNSISSIRQIGGGGPPVQGAFGERPRAVLYEGQGMSGRSFVIDRDYMRNLEGTGFNDRAQSLHVDSGYWLFCSEPFFQGECRTFGPGDYIALPSVLNNRISSGRKIADNYPYRDRPNWESRR